jgi:hypothetical protein
VAAERGEGGRGRHKNNPNQMVRLSVCAALAALLFAASGVKAVVPPGWTRLPSTQTLSGGFPNEIQGSGVAAFPSPTSFPADPSGQISISRGFLISGGYSSVHEDQQFLLEVDSSAPGVTYKGILEHRLFDPRDTISTVHIGGRRGYGVSPWPEFHLFIGGHSDNFQSQNIVDVLEVATGIWTSALWAGPSAQEGTETGLDLGPLAMFAGGANPYRSTVDVWNSTSNVTAQLTSGNGGLPTPRGWTCGASTPTHAVLAGGWDGSNLHATALVFDLATFSLSSPQNPAQVNLARGVAECAAAVCCLNITPCYDFLCL